MSIGKITFYVYECAALKNTQLYGKMSPYLEFTIGNSSTKSGVVIDGGDRNPNFKGKSFSLYVEEKDEVCNLVIWNQRTTFGDNIIAKIDFDMQELKKWGDEKKRMELKDVKDGKGGTINIKAVWESNEMLLRKKEKESKEKESKENESKDDAPPDFDEMLEQMGYPTIEANTDPVKESAPPGVVTVPPNNTSTSSIPSPINAYIPSPVNNSAPVESSSQTTEFAPQITASAPQITASAPPSVNPNFVAPTVTRAPSAPTVPRAQGKKFVEKVDYGTKTKIETNEYTKSTENKEIIVENSTAYGASRSNSLVFSDEPGILTLVKIFNDGKKIFGFQTIDENGKKSKKNAPKKRLPCSKLKLEEGEGIVSVSGANDDKGIIFLEIGTNKGVKKHFGGRDPTGLATVFNLYIPDGSIVVGFHGKYGDHLHSVGVITTPDPH